MKSGDFVHLFISTIKPPSSFYGCNRHRLIVLGGYGADNNYDPDVWIFDTSANKWSSVEEPAVMRQQGKLFRKKSTSLRTAGQLALAGCDKVFVVGGYSRRLQDLVVMNMSRTGFS